LSTPLLLGTWSFAQAGIDLALPALLEGGDPLDACIQTCETAEQDELVDSVGYGGLPDASGTLSLDACVMRSPSDCGSVCCVTQHLEVTRLARYVMEKTPHVMLAGTPADHFASQMGLIQSDLLSPAAREAWFRWCQTGVGGHGSPTALRPTDPGGGGGGALFQGQLKGSDSAGSTDDERRWPSHDTIGILARGLDGSLAGACSTSGTAFKLPGRVGDSPIIGHGLYVEPGVGMAVCTGEGELVMGACGAFAVVEALRRGATPAEAGGSVLERIDRLFSLEKHHQLGIIVSDASGRHIVTALRDGFRAVIGDHDGSRVLEPEIVLHSGT
jgi:N4-(beta-N-acetylglucosaminyl)-L-asparaginase